MAHASLSILTLRLFTGLENGYCTCNYVADKLFHWGLDCSLETELVGGRVLVVDDYHFKLLQKSCGLIKI